MEETKLIFVFLLSFGDLPFDELYPQFADMLIAIYCDFGSVDATEVAQRAEKLCDFPLKKKKYKQKSEAIRAKHEFVECDDCRHTVYARSLFDCF